MGGNFADLTGVDWRLPDRSQDSADSAVVQYGRIQDERIWAPWARAAAISSAIQASGTSIIRCSRAFPLVSRLKLQFRGELFNAFNHANLGAPAVTVIATNFGRISSARSPRIAQLALRLFF